MSIIIDMVAVPWEALKTMGHLRYRLESTATPASSPCATPTTRLSEKEATPKSAASSPSPLYLSSKSPAALFPPPEVASSSASPLYISSQAAMATAVSPAANGETISGAAFYMNTPVNKLAVSGEATAARWGLTIDVTRVGERARS